MDDHYKQHVYHSASNDIIITLTPTFMPHHSNIDDSLFVWYYQVQIENRSDSPIQITNRFWKIIDAYSRITEVTGSGIGGEQPILNPNELYEYTSAVPLSTPSGFMSGHYIVESADGNEFNVEIPAFSLDSPYVNQSLN